MPDVENETQTSGQSADLLVRRGEADVAAAQVAVAVVATWHTIDAAMCPTDSQGRQQPV